MVSRPLYCAHLTGSAKSNALQLVAAREAEADVGECDRRELGGRVVLAGRSRCNACVGSALPSARDHRQELEVAAAGSPRRGSRAFAPGTVCANDALAHDHVVDAGLERARYREAHAAVVEAPRNARGHDARERGASAPTCRESRCSRSPAGMRRGSNTCEEIADSSRGSGLQVVLHLDVRVAQADVGPEVRRARVLALVLLRVLRDREADRRCNPARGSVRGKLARPASRPGPAGSKARLRDGLPRNLITERRMYPG